MCATKDFSNVFYRHVKREQVRSRRKYPQVVNLPANTGNDRNTTKTVTESMPLQTTQPMPSNFSSLANRCNRGIAVWTHNGSSVCFCPPQYHGNECQRHTDRIHLLFHVNYTNSTYQTSSSVAIVNKFLVLFLYNDQVLSTDEFHTRPATEMATFKKKSSYLFYSRSHAHMTNKRNRYMNRSNIIEQHPYAIRIEAYEMALHVPSKRFAVWQILLYFDYLPVYRSVKILRFVPKGRSSDDPCRRHPCNENQQCYRLQNQPSKHICLCKSRFSGENCSHIDPKCNGSYCSSNALCQSGYRGLINGQEWPYCICPYNYIGQRCEVFPQTCLRTPCKNGGTCYQSSKADDYRCECNEAHYGKNCEKTKQLVQLQINRNATVAYPAVVVQYLEINFHTLELVLADQRIFNAIPESLDHLHEDTNLPDVILLKLYLSDRSDIYLISLIINGSSLSTNASISEHNRCKDVQTLFAAGDTPSIIKYHSLCRMHRDLLCFTDSIYLCLCHENHEQAECFNYDHTSDKCDECFANGRCLKGRTLDEFICICPACYEGHFCQFNFQSFAFTLDQLFFYDLLPNSARTNSVTYYSLLLAPVLLFLIGLVNNACCFATFRRSKCLRIGTGHYLLLMSIFNQANLTFLIVRLVHLTMIIVSPHSAPLLDTVLCKSANYLLLTSTRIIYWLGSLIAIERLYVAFFVNGQWLKTPRIARRISALAIVTVLTVSSYELVFVHPQVSSDGEKHSSCTVTFPDDHSLWLHLHGTVEIIDSLAPFLINLCSTIGIICLVTKKKMNATRRDATRTQSIDASQGTESMANMRSHFRLLKDVLIENKELVIGPAFTLVPQVFSLPFFIASFMLKCRNLHTNHLRYLLIASYFTAFIPPLTSFLLYISPSSFYSQEWQLTPISQWISAVKRRCPTIPWLCNNTRVDEPT